MIKHKNEIKASTKAQNVQESSTQNSIAEKKVTIPGDVIVDRYILKEINTCGNAEQIKLNIAIKLKEASNQGYRYIDRIQANMSESVMIFEIIDK